jgi:hypothetical protein
MEPADGTVADSVKAANMEQYPNPPVGAVVFVPSGYGGKGTIVQVESIRGGNNYEIALDNFLAGSSNMRVFKYRMEFTVLSESANYTEREAEEPVTLPLGTKVRLKELGPHNVANGMEGVVEKVDGQVYTIRLDGMYEDGLQRLQTHIQVPRQNLEVVALAAAAAGAGAEAGEGTTSKPVVPSPTPAPVPAPAVVSKAETKAAGVGEGTTGFETTAGAGKPAILPPGTLVQLNDVNGGKDGIKGFIKGIDKTNRFYNIVLEKEYEDEYETMTQDIRLPRENFDVLPRGAMPTDPLLRRV